MPALISKAEATALATEFKNTLRDRVASFLIARARQGFVGGDFPYTDQDLGANANAVRTALQNLGWTVTVDAVNKIVQIS